MSPVPLPVPPPRRHHAVARTSSAGGRLQPGGERRPAIGPAPAPAKHRHHPLAATGWGPLPLPLPLPPLPGGSCADASPARARARARVACCVLRLSDGTTFPFSPFFFSIAVILSTPSERYSLSAQHSTNTAYLRFALFPYTSPLPPPRIHPHLFRLYAICSLYLLLPPSRLLSKPGPLPDTDTYFNTPDLSFISVVLPYQARTIVKKIPQI